MSRIKSVVNTSTASTANTTNNANTVIFGAMPPIKPSARAYFNEIAFEEINHWSL